MDDLERGCQGARVADAAHITDAEDRRTLLEWAERLKLSVPDLEVFCRNGFYYDKIPPQDGPNRRGLLAHLKKSELPISRWLLISALYPECLYSEPERRKRLRALYRVVLLLIRRALLRQAEDPFKKERTPYWDPIAEVCRDLEIAPSKLSAFCKEFPGNSLSQVVDCVRAERVKKLMRAELRAFVRQRSAHRATLAAPAGTADDCWAVWSDLKKSRKWPAFSQNTWALRMGFATYRRMYRACVAEYGMAPHQLLFYTLPMIVTTHHHHKLHA